MAIRESYSPHDVATVKFYDAIAAVEKIGGMPLDQLAWLIGSMPQFANTEQGKFEQIHVFRDWPVSQGLEPCEKLLALLPEMEACKTNAEAFLRMAEYMNREDELGNAVTRVLKRYRS